MGRYVNGDFEYKFWFGTQPSSDILEFYGKDVTFEHPEYGTQYAHEWIEEDKPKVEKRLKQLNKRFTTKHQMSPTTFEKKIDAKGYTWCSDDKETDRPKWKSMCRDLSKICLGKVILAAMNENDWLDNDHIYVEYEG